MALPPAAGRHDGQVVAGALQQQCVLGLEAGHGDLVERQVVQQPVGEGEVLPQPPVLPHRLLLHRHRLPGAGHRGHAAAANIVILLMYQRCQRNFVKSSLNSEKTHTI